MDKTSFANITGSLCYGGEKHILTPGMNTLPDGLQATLEYRQVADNAHHLLLRLRNTGSENTKQITLPKTLDLYIPAGETVRYHSLSGDSCGAESFVPIDCTLTEALHAEPANGKSSDTTGFPFFDLTADGMSAVFAIGWTGQWALDIVPDCGGVTVQVGLCDADFYLLPGEEVRLPSVLIVTGEGVRQTRRAFRRVMREHFSPKDRLLPGQNLPISIQCFDRYFGGVDGVGTDSSWATEAGQLRTLTAARKIPAIDTQWLDAAWFEKGFPHGVGNFRFCAGFPRGLKPVTDEVHKHGMAFVLWFELERVFEGSDLYPQTEKLLIYPPYYDTRLLNLADPATLKWLEETLIRMIRENNIDVYRQDFNMDPLPYWRHNDAPGRKGMLEIGHITGLYHLWDTLLAEFPNFFIDDCSSGGRRLDLETMSRAVSLWRSDTGCFPETPERRVTVYSQNQILTLSEYLPFHSCATWNTDAYAIRSTATQGLACNFAIFDPEFDFETTARVMDEVQELRGYWNGEFYPLTVPTNDETVWCAYQLSQGDAGVAYVFRREFARQNTMVLYLQALEPEANYRVTMTDDAMEQQVITCDGKTLQGGLNVVISHKRGSVTVKYQKI